MRSPSIRPEQLSDADLATMLEQAIVEQEECDVGWRCHQHFARSDTQAGLERGLEQFAATMRSQIPAHSGYIIVVTDAGAEEALQEHWRQTGKRVPERSKIWVAHVITAFLWSGALPQSGTGGRERDLPVSNRYRPAVKELTKFLLTESGLKVVKAHLPETKVSTDRLRSERPIGSEAPQPWQTRLYASTDDNP
jgi:hypothetical protein